MRKTNKEKSPLPSIAEQRPTPGSTPVHLPTQQPDTWGANEESTMTSNGQHATLVVAAQLEQGEHPVQASSSSSQSNPRSLVVPPTKVAQSRKLSPPPASQSNSSDGQLVKRQVIATVDKSTTTTSKLAKSSQTSPGPHGRQTTAGDEVKMFSRTWFANFIGNAFVRAWLALVTFFVAIRAIAVRIGFIVFACIAIVTVVGEKKDWLFWNLSLTLLPSLIELVLALRSFINRSAGKSAVGKWFSPCTFAYLICACPPIWILELHHMDQVNNSTAVMAERGPQKLARLSFEPSWSQNESLMMMGMSMDEFIESQLTNSSDPNSVQVRVRRSLIDFEQRTRDDEDLKNRIRRLEQLLLLSIIVGRWLLPREGISRDQLSQLLLINIGTAADILELFEAFNEAQVRGNDFLRAIILCLWQASLVQFCFNKTALRDTKMHRRNSRNPYRAAGTGSQANDTDLESTDDAKYRTKCCFCRLCCCCGSEKCCCRKRGRSPGRDNNEDRSDTGDESSSDEQCGSYEGRYRDHCPAFCQTSISEFCAARPCLCCETELWAIGLSLLLQDLPFFSLRVTLIFKFSVYSSSNIFFTFKNTLLIILQVFRSVVIVFDAFANFKQQQKNAGNGFGSLNDVDLDLEQKMHL